MLGYDTFSRFYDASVERLYVEARAAAVEALDLSGATCVLDAPTGTGQSLPGLRAAMPAEAALIGLDFSAGMLAKAQARSVPGARLVQADVRAVDLAALGRTEPVDRLHVFLGLSVFPDWEVAFERLWGLLAPGGRCVVVDVHADPPGVQGRMVQWTAGADLRRRTWEPLRRLAEGYEERPLSQRWEHGGRIFLASGRRPA
jgi:demethylmenaquinone methyltransferase/2-methoxy-6-polyprenyl-1,4-benzoquinol methylase